MRAEVSGRLIRRYDNRKLYDAAERRYVTLDQLRALVAGGEEVTVLDQRSGDDLTNLTLAQILLEGLRQRTARIPRPLLVQLVRLASGPAPSQPRHRGRPAAQRALQEAEKIVGGLLARGRLSLEEALDLRRDIVRTVGGLVSEAQAGALAGFHRLLQAQPLKASAPRPPRGRRRPGAPSPAPRRRARGPRTQSQ